MSRYRWQFESLDSAINPAWMKQLKSLDSAINPTWMKQFESLDSAINPAWMKQFESLGSAINPASMWMKRFESLHSVINPASMKQFEALNSLYTEHELSEFSEVLSKVGYNLEQGVVSEREAEKVLQKLPCFFLLFLKYLFNYIVMPLFVGACLQPLLIEYIQNNNEPRRVQKNAIKKLPQNNGVETSAVNRFISGDGVRLRASASIKSEVLSKLNFGQLVYVLEKDRSWVKVAVLQKDGNSIEGWVFNEYTERFRN